MWLELFLCFFSSVRDYHFCTHLAKSCGYRRFSEWEYEENRRRHRFCYSDSSKQSHNPRKRGQILNCHRNSYVCPQTLLSNFYSMAAVLWSIVCLPFLMVFLQVALVLIFRQFCMNPHLQKWIPHRFKLRKWKLLVKKRCWLLET